MRLQPIFDIAALCHLKGIKDAIVCPGSRCAPLTISFARHPGIKTRTISDERSAGFIALGIAQQTKRTVVLICTSGTAAYNFAPAVAEAFYQRIPLLILTADRPVEWIGQWDGQTISQQKIYGDHVLRSYQLPQDYDHADSKWSIQRIINEAINVSQGDVHGPVHVNVPLREPLYSESISFSDDIRVIEKIPVNHSLPPKTFASINSFKKILVVGGQGRLDIDLINALNSFVAAGDIAIVGDVISNLHPLPSAVRYSDTFLPALDHKTKEALRPDLLITIGQSVISKNLKLFLRAFKPVAHWHVDESSNEIIDPFQSMTTQVCVSPENFFTTFAQVVQSNNKDYSKRWIDLDQKAHSTTSDFFNSENTGEFTFVDRLLKSIPDHSNLHLANSMAVRYANFCGLAENKKGVQVYGNRGTSGIDGCTSTVVGHAMSSDAIHTLVTGDVAFFYDRNAFWNNYLTPNLRIVVLNNHGGAIFGIIDGPGTTPEGDEYFITRQPLTAKHLASEFNLDYKSISDNENINTTLEEFFKMEGRPKILEFESGSKEAKELFLRFKEKVKNSYAA
ncbi:MAG: 2-succinyl-5-enolpyruvyl-6-hydroxy-3-cyclohexene-1-carboxylic-acid synthase [Bacteroidota bacterium]